MSQLTLFVAGGEFPTGGQTALDHPEAGATVPDDGERRRSDRCPGGAGGDEGGGQESPEHAQGGDGRPPGQTGKYLATPYSYFILKKRT